MSIGTTIKRLRREKDITQEQLAEYLGITSRAISQWECDRTAPDISQLPVLCQIFDVSSDILLGIDIEKNSEEIKKYIDKSVNYEKQGDFESSAATLREALRKFPKSFEIMLCLANACICVNKRNCVNAYDEALGLCKRVLAECTDSFTRYEALSTLVRIYDYADKQDEMLKLAEELPNVFFSREDVMRYRWKGDVDYEKFQGYMDFLIGRVVEMLGIAAQYRHDNNEFMYSLEDRILLWKTRVALLELLFPDGDFLFYAQFGDQACTHLCSLYLEKGDYEEAWHWLEKRADFVIHMETYDFNAPFTSPINRGVIPGGWIVSRGDKFSQKMLNWLTTDEEAAVLRNDKRYEDLVNRLKEIPMRN
ncbi:MAG: helix-turn-helix transcriptional regulator [Oscillospiraceae bacterium]|nr:helix-turn-helix transcriptional regulator [Oscillospiraceae bacterium]